MRKTRSKRRGPRAFLRDASGAITVEFVIWMPVFLLILMFMADGAGFFIRQANMWNVARDAARGMATARFTTCSNTTAATGTTTDAEAYSLGQLLFGGRHYTVSCWFPQSSATSCAQKKTTTNATNNDIVEICLPIQYAGVFGALAVWSGLAGTSFNVEVTMLTEQ